MIEVAIPGRARLRLEHLVLDYNGTLACDGQPIEGVITRLVALANQLELHVVTADTFGGAALALAGVPCEVAVLPAGDQGGAKRRFVEELGPRGVVSVGNGRNDVGLLEAAALGIAVIQTEGAAVAALQAADLVCRDIRDALDLLRQPLRLVAGLRR